MKMNHSPGNVPGKGLGTASMVLGIVALAFFWLAYLFFPTILAIIGLVLGVVGKKKLIEAGAPTGAATAGIVTSIIALAVTIIAWVLCIACIGAIGTAALYW
jgi:hypothetical protein